MAVCHIYTEIVLVWLYQEYNFCLVRLYYLCILWHSNTEEIWSCIVLRLLSYPFTYTHFSNEENKTPPSQNRLIFDSFKEAFVCISGALSWRSSAVILDHHLLSAERIHPVSRLLNHVAPC